jgi:uridylate kinase
MSQLKYRRILLKLSGEALMGNGDYGIDPDIINGLAEEIIEAQQAGAEIGVVINALAMQDALEKHGAYARVMSAIKINQICEDYIRRRAVRHLEKGRIALFAAGTGNPFFTTDSAAALRATEINAELLLKATKVDGIYDADPKKNPDATRFDTLTYDEVLSRNLQVMDTAAFALCRDNNIPLRIYDMSQAGTLMRILKGENIGTLVTR